MNKHNLNKVTLCFLIIGIGTLTGCAPTSSSSSSDPIPQASDDSSESSDLTPAAFYGNSNLPKVAVGDFHSCRIFSDGSLKCWGFNISGQLGQEHTFDIGDSAGEMASLQAVDLGTGRKAISVVAGVRYTCVLLDNLSVKCFGEAGYGTLGYEDKVNRGVNSGEMGDWLPEIDLGEGRTAHAIAGGSRHVCALLDHGDVKCWGDNSKGQLGIGDPYFRGDNFGEMGDQLPAAFLGVGRKAVSISAGGSTTCAVLDDNTAKCWGSNTSGVLGQGSTTSFGQAPGEMQSLQPIQLGHFRFPKQMASGVTSTCALLDNDTIKCWGDNFFGQLGQEDKVSRGDNPGEMGDLLLSIHLGVQQTASSIRTSGTHACAILLSNGLKCWGYNSYGQLGLGDLNDRGDSAGEMTALANVNLGTGKYAIEVATGLYHTCAILNDFTTKCWGRNERGALGLGDKQSRGDSAGEMGDSLSVVP